MSERSESIEAAVDSEWRSTGEIIERAGYAGDPCARQCAARRLGALRRQGRVEERVMADGPSGGSRAEWRLKA